MVNGINMVEFDLKVLLNDDEMINYFDDKEETIFEIEFFFK